MDLGLQIAIRLLIAAYVGVGIWLTIIVVQKAGFGWWWGIAPWLPSIFWVLPGIEIVGVLTAPAPLILVYVFAFVEWPVLRAPAREPPLETVQWGAEPVRQAPRMMADPGPVPPEDDSGATQLLGHELKTAPMPIEDLQPTSWLLTGFDASGRVVRIEMMDDDLAANADGFVVGRSPQSSQMLIADDSVSRRHARLFADDGRLFVEDLGSANGTLVDGIQLEPNDPMPIDKGDTVEIGAVRLSVSRG